MGMNWVITAMVVWLLFFPALVLCPLLVGSLLKGQAGHNVGVQLPSLSCVQQSGVRIW
jgi:hypothetical protein